MNPNMQQNILNRRVEKVLPTKDKLQKLLESGKKIRLYQGFDPTGSRLHLGHTVGLRKLMDFADAGHEVIFLFGTGTVLVGDPSERDTGRKLITQEDIDQNIKNWKKMVSPIVDFDKITIKQNGNWLVPLTLKDIVKIGSNISSVQLFKRESFTRRISNGDTVWYHETMYPLLQGYDSVAMDVDLEIGGTDQEFNMLVGRELQRKMNNREKYVLTTPMIVGTDGGNMSKTTGNCIWLDDTPEDMYGKLMSLPDQYLNQYLTQVTNISLERIQEIDDGVKTGSIHPMEAKKELAAAVVQDFHGPDAVKAAEDHFQSTVQKGQAPETIDTFKVNQGDISLLDLLGQANLGQSNSQIKRVIKQGGVSIDGKTITDPSQTLEVKGGEVIKFGKREFRKTKAS